MFNKYLVLLLVILASFSACKKSTGPIGPSKPSQGLQGQLYGNGPYGGWFPLKASETIVVFKGDSVSQVVESKSDTTGEFKIQLIEGIYCLSVKESYCKYITGPFEVFAGNYTQAKAYDYDCRLAKKQLRANQSLRLRAE